jgi:hypothetical protein
MSFFQMVDSPNRSIPARAPVIANARWLTPGRNSLSSFFLPSLARELKMRNHNTCRV